MQVFWSSVGSHVVGSAIVHDMYGNKSSGNNKNAKKREAKIQQAFTKLGFYKGKFDGDLNTLESRTAIEKFQEHYWLEDTGTLSKKEIEDVIYMFDLFAKYKNLSLSEENDNQIEVISKALNKLEDKIIINDSFINKILLWFRNLFGLVEYVSYKMNDIRKQQRSDILKQLNLTKYPNHTIIDIKTKLMWHDIKWLNIATRKYNDAVKYCKNLKIGNFNDCRLPTIDELDDISKKKSMFIYYFKDKRINKYSNWSSSLAFHDKYRGDAHNQYTFDRNQIKGGKKTYGYYQGASALTNCVRDIK
jgi:hypothetical protein